MHSKLLDNYTLDLFTLVDVLESNEILNLGGLFCVVWIKANAASFSSPLLQQRFTKKARIIP